MVASGLLLLFILCRTIPSHTFRTCFTISKGANVNRDAGYVFDPHLGCDIVFMVIK